jgi:hypothetical protein
LYTFNFCLFVQFANDLIFRFGSVRTTQRYLTELGLQHKGVESPVEDIISAVQSELHGTARRLGVGQIWKRLRYNNGLLVKRCGYFLLSFLLYYLKFPVTIMFHTLRHTESCSSFFVHIKAEVWK